MSFSLVFEKYIKITTCLIKDIQCSSDYACHVFYQGNVISTPAVKGTILPGITRKSIIDVAVSKGFQVNHPSNV